MSSQTLSVAVPQGILTQLRKRARQAKRTVEAEVVHMLAEAIAVETLSNGKARPGKKKPGITQAAAQGSSPPSNEAKPFRSSLADLADEHAEHWGTN